MKNESEIVKKVADAIFAKYPSFLRINCDGIARVAIEQIYKELDDYRVDGSSNHWASLEALGSALKAR